MDVEDVIIMSENHVEQLMTYFINLAVDKVDSDFGFDDCQEAAEADDAVAIDEDMIKTLMII